eukprot:gene13508-28652_t
MEYNEVPPDLQPILPPGDVEIDFDNINCELGGQECDIVEDSELLRDVFEIGDDSRIMFPTNTTHHLLVLYIKNIGRFLEVVVRVNDEDGNHRRISMTNKRSNIAINKNNAHLPLQVGIGWQYLCVDLRDVVKRCFGSTYTTCYEVQVRGPTRVSKIYFQLKHYAEVDLPMFLRSIFEKVRIDLDKKLISTERIYTTEINEI